MKKLVDFRDIDVTYTGRVNPIRNFTVSEIKEHWPFLALHSTDDRVCVLRMDRRFDNSDEEAYDMESVTQIEGPQGIRHYEYEPLTPYVALQLDIIDGAECNKLNIQFGTQEESRQLESDFATYNKVREMFLATLGAYPEDLPKNSGNPVDKLKDKLFPALKSETQPACIPPLTKL